MHTLKHATRCVVAVVTLAATAQFAFAQNTENPRGIYKLTSLTGKQGETKAPFDQYKICTDSVTLHLSIEGNHFSLGSNDRSIYNYTGEAPDPIDNLALRIYDSNAQRFTLKWWSKYRDHLFFPENDWCVEKYESGQFSPTGRRLIDALTSTGNADKANPLIGTWRVLGMMDELRNVKQELGRLQDPKSRERRREDAFVIFTPENMVHTGQWAITNVTYIDKKNMKIGNLVMHLTWLSKDIVALEVKQGWRTDYEIWQRTTDGQSVLSRIASIYVKK
ncbi:MAG: hypothetical protein IKG96_00435 [Bacteroidaceae bacterium]|nr:hypothetical protein [Bacteroidaceae bacterium]